MSYSIKKIADMMGVTTATIRYYDEEGLLPNIKRMNGRRIFEDEDFKWLRVLNCMKKINMPIKKIKKIKKYVELAKQGDSTLEQRYRLILEQKAAIKNQINELNMCLQEFEYKEWYYQTAIEAGTEEILKDITSISPTLEVDKIPKNYKKEGK